MSEIAIPDPEENLPVNSDASQLSFDQLMGDAPVLHTFDSEDLIDKSHLLGIPFAITEVSFRPTEVPDPTNPKKSIKSDYVSVVGRTGSEAWLDKAAAAGRIPNYTDWREIGVIEPNQRIVFNDGSTGVRRQLVKILHENGLINVGGDVDAKGNRDYDRRIHEWDDAEFDEDGTADTVTINKVYGAMTSGPLVIRVFKGLRVSRYAFGAGEAETYYLS